MEVNIAGVQPLPKTLNHLFSMLGMLRYNVGGVQYSPPVIALSSGAIEGMYSSCNVQRQASLPSPNLQYLQRSLILRRKGRVNVQQIDDYVGVIGVYLCFIISQNTNIKEFKQ